MKPLVIVTTFNRSDETHRTLAALERTADIRGEIELAIMDNNSDEDLRHWLRAWWEHVRPIGGGLHLLPMNIGCPRALNLALQYYRRPGQPVVKLDNDVVIETPEWVFKVGRFVEKYNSAIMEDGKRHTLAMVSAYYDGVTREGNRLRSTQRFPTMDFVEADPSEDKEPPDVGPSMVYHIAPIIGHCVWHTGAFMDRVRFYDVLAPGHLYGFEDLILTHKADVMGWDLVAWDGWKVENVQRHNSLGDGRNSHIEAMRPLYNERATVISHGGTLRTGPDGKPVS